MTQRLLAMSALLMAAVLAASALPAQEPAAAQPIAEARPWLKKLARGNEVATRMEAAEMLGYIGDPATLSDLAENFEPHPPEWERAMADALGRFGGPRALRVLTTLINNRYLLQGKSWENYRVLGEAVGRIDHKSREAYDLMRNRYDKGCQYAESKPEEAMLFCMAWYGDEKAIGALVDMMKTSAPERARLVAERLGEIGNKRSDEELCMLVDYSEDLKLKKIAATSLGRRHAKLAVESLVDSLSKGLELEASQALGAIGDKSAVRELKPLLMHKDPAVKLSAAFALARLGDKGGVETARAMPADKDPVAAAKAAATLAAAGEEDGSAKLKAAWGNLDAKQRWWFMRDNLAGDAWALPFLKDLTQNDTYPGIKRAACDATAGK